MKFFHGIPTRALMVLLAPAVLGSSAAPAIDRVSYISNQAQSVDVVIVAHQDDWQLFMGDVVARQVRLGNPVVFIISLPETTAETHFIGQRENGERLSRPVLVLASQLPIPPLINVRWQTLSNTRSGSARSATRNPTFSACQMDAEAGLASHVTPTKVCGNCAQSVWHRYRQWMEAPPTTAGQT